MGADKNRLQAMFARLANRIFNYAHSNIENFEKVRAYRKAVNDNQVSSDLLHDITKKTIEKLREALEHEQ